MNKVLYSMLTSALLVTTCASAEPYIGSGLQHLHSQLDGKNTYGFFIQGGYDLGLMDISVSTGKTTGSGHSYVDMQGDIHSTQTDISFMDLGIGHRFDIAGLSVMPRIGIAKLDQHGQTNSAIEYGLTLGYPITKNLEISASYNYMDASPVQGKNVDADGFDIGVNYHF